MLDAWSPLFEITLITAVVAPIAAFYFSLGRLTCPEHDRLPLSDLDGVGIRATVSRGWREMRLRRFDR